MNKFAYKQFSLQKLTKLGTGTLNEIPIFDDVTRKKQQSQQNQ